MGNRKTMVKRCLKKVLSFIKMWIAGTFSNESDISATRQFAFLFVLACVIGMYTDKVSVDKLYFGGVMIATLLGKVLVDNALKSKKS